MAKAIALLSGGLDSTLAILALLRQGIDITAVTFLTQFGCDITDRSSCSSDPLPVAEKFGFRGKLNHLADKFIDIVKNPRYGYGKNMNPCIDCRILMLKEAKTIMDLIGAEFLITGEVLGQRPMSQRKETFPLIDREAQVEGLVLRPLSARLLKPTKAETDGVVRRDKLYDFSGRTRKPQMALARELGLTDYPAPAGGCLLTDPVYSYRLKDLFSHNKCPELREFNLLKTGRHFRLNDICKTIIGRNKEENHKIEDYIKEGDITMRVEGVGSPLTLLTGKTDENALIISASMTARYSDAKHKKKIDVTVYRGLNEFLYKLTVDPAAKKLLDSMRIEEKSSHSKPCKSKAVC